MHESVPEDWNVSHTIFSGAWIMPFYFKSQFTFVVWKSASWRFCKISRVVFDRRKNFIQVWNKDDA